MKMGNELRGGFRFTADVIDKEVPVGIVGNYLLSEGLKSTENRLIVTYVGRSDDLNRRLKEHLLRLRKPRALTVVRANRLRLYGSLRLLMMTTHGIVCVLFPQTQKGQYHESFS
jgi:hypothetical protein